MVNFHKIQNCICKGLEIDIQLEQKCLELFPGSQLELSHENAKDDHQSQLDRVDQEVQVRPQEMAQQSHTFALFRAERVPEFLGRLHNCDQPSVKLAFPARTKVLVGSVESRKYLIDEFAGENELENFEGVHEIDVEIGLFQQAELVFEELW